MMLFGAPDVTAIAAQLVDKASRTGFRMFRDARFRECIAFDTLEPMEQDRMFNELIASNLVLLMLMLDTFVNVSGNEHREYIRVLNSQIPESFTQLLGDMGIAREHIQTWLQLLNLRRDEYEQTRIDYRDKFPELGEGNPWIQVVAIGCLSHIRRGEAIKEDPLMELLLEQAINISGITRKSVEYIVLSR